MTFGEKVKVLRKNRDLSQKELAELAGVSLRTVCGWELDGRYPKKRVLYQTLAEILGCESSYLMADNEEFLTQVTSEYGHTGAAQAEKILAEAGSLFAGGDLSDDDKLAFLNEIQQLYLDSKVRAKKYTPRKYKKD